LALVIGDFHIPTRSSDVPESFKELLKPNKVQYVFSTGNLGCREVVDWVKSLSSQAHIVRGDFDEVRSLAALILLLYA
jgi:vacuolar protein sorting-associated protein 29